MSRLRGQSGTEIDSTGAKGYGRAEQDLGLPDAVRVAERSLVLAAVSGRGALECDEDRDRAEDRRRNMCVWFNHLGISHEIEESEAALIRTPIGQLDRQSMIDACWRSEGMAVLAWALQRAELPRYDERDGGYATAARLGFLTQRSQTVLASPSLRPLPEILQGNKTYLTVHWRLRNYLLGPDVIDFAGYVSWAKWAPLSLLDVDLIDGDIAIQASASIAYQTISAS
jgi:hypothetical protein